MADLHEHPAIGIVIARLEQRFGDVEELIGVSDKDDTHEINLGLLEKACHDLVDFASFLAIEAYYDGASEAEHEGNQEHLDTTIDYLRGIALRLPLIEGG